MKLTQAAATTAAAAVLVLAPYRVTLRFIIQLQAMTVIENIEEKKDCINTILLKNCLAKNQSKFQSTYCFIG